MRRYSCSLVLYIFAMLLAAPSLLSAQHLLVPMDDQQRNHLKAYGLTYNALVAGGSAEWLLNYRGGSFVLPDSPELHRRASLDGITTERLSAGALASIRAEIAGGNMEAVPLEKAPRIAVYTPPGSQPWDDAVTLALEYAGIPYAKLWDDEVIQGELSEYDWLHLHHEDFTGQLSKFFINYRGAPWFLEQLRTTRAAAERLGFADISALKKGVAERIRAYVYNGGFLFAMCGATETLDLAIAGHDVDIVASFINGAPVDERANELLDWSRSLAFRGARLETSPFITAQSDIDGHQVNVPGRRQPLGSFTLFSFSAKIDPVPSMLVQNHRSVLPDFYGVTASFTRRTLKPSVVILAEEAGAPWVKYLHGSHGSGSFSFLGGHDPEDPQHAIGAPPTDLSLHPDSPGYRLILNNVLFPAAKKKPLKT
jgi:hypothetical protein